MCVLHAASSDHALCMHHLIMTTMKVASYGRSKLSAALLLRFEFLHTEMITTLLTPLSKIEQREEGMESRFSRMQQKRASSAERDMLHVRRGKSCIAVIPEIVDCTFSLALCEYYT